MVDASVAVTLGLAGIGGVIWLVRLEGRQNTHEKECEQRQKHAEEFRTDVKTEFRDMRADFKGEFRALHAKLDGRE